MIVLYKGKRGAGKTLSMVKDGLKYFQNGNKVLRNFSCNFGEQIDEEEILKIDKNSKISQCVLMVDEIQIFFDSRSSMKKQNLTFSNFIQQIRKRGIILLATTQFAGTVDLRFRQHVDVVAMPKYFKEFEVCEITYYDMTSLESDFSNEEKELKSVKIVYNAKDVFNLYKTEELIR